MEETFAQIEGAAAHSLPDVSVSITNGGSIVGQGVTASGGAIEVCGGNLDGILRSFGGDGGVEGGDTTFGGKASRVVKKTSSLGSKLSADLERELKHIHEEASDLEALASLAKSALKQASTSESKKVLEEIVSHVESAATDIRKTASHEVKLPRQSASDFIDRNAKFVRAIKSLGAHLNEPSMAGMLSLSFSSVNELKKLGKEVSEALRVVKLKKSEYLGSPLSKIDGELTKKLANDHASASKTKEFLSAWSKLMQNHGHRSEIQQFIGGVSVDGKTDRLGDRLLQSRHEVRTMINKFIDAFGININDVAKTAEDMARSFGKNIDYSEETVTFLETFSRLSEYLSRNTGKIYQHLLELNEDQVDSKEIKMRFLSNMRDLAARADEVGKHTEGRTLASHCRSVVETVNKFSDMIKTHRDTVKKEGGSTESMNELFSVDASKIDITGLLNPLENLKLAIAKIGFFRNIAIFRSNLDQTNKELAVYSKDYTKSVGKSIGEAITKIKNDYADIIKQVSDNKAGMGLEIDMYNESQSVGKKISKEKLKQMYKWQCDARVGLYKTIEAIDLYLLHFTEAVTKNPDVVSDLQKLLTATRVIAKWYDAKSGDNLVRMFESLADDDAAIDAPDYVTGAYVDNTPSPEAINRNVRGLGLDPADPVVRADINAVLANPAVIPANRDAAFVTAVTENNTIGSEQYADLTTRVESDRAHRIYERCRRAVEGVVVLKNIISYFITIGEKYGGFKGEKNIYMAPSNIYKNLVNYIWVSALDMNTTGTEVLNDNNELKQMITFDDTKVQFAQVHDLDPEVLGINFNRHSIDKLRILKSQQELNRLREFLGSMGPDEVHRVRQYVSSVFARLGKTEYIFEMFPFGIYDVSVMDRAQLRAFLHYIIAKIANPVGQAYQTRLQVEIGGQAAIPIDEAQIDAIVADTFQLASELRQTQFIISAQMATDENNPVFNSALFVPLRTFMTMDMANMRNLNVLQYRTLRQGPGQGAAYAARNTGHGFINGFMVGLFANTDEMKRVSNAQRVAIGLTYCVSSMVNTYKRNHSNSVFAVDDTYFILAIKAVAGKVMAVTGINSLYKDPTVYQNRVMQNQTRLIMGGAAGGATGDAEIIDGAVELYVRLPLLVEFYRHIFDQGNRDYKAEAVNDLLDNERVSFVPEIGNIWSGLIINIFDKSKHIDTGLYTTDNMGKIVSEINAIYKHYKGTIPADRLVRHIVLELVSEINRRYGIVKRQDLQQYYRALNATKRNRIDVGENNYTNIDLDILDESLEFEEKSPSEEFIKFKSAITDPSTSSESKISKLTDYKILKEFRERIQNAFSGQMIDNGANLITITDRIRQLKNAVKSKASQDEKYDMIIKSIQESESMNQSSNDIFSCFHEFVITPLSTLYDMYKALDVFIVTTMVITGCAVNDDPTFALTNSQPVLRTPTPNERTLGQDLVDMTAAGVAGVGGTALNSITGADNETLLIGNGSKIQRQALVNSVNANGHNGLLQTTLLQNLMRFSGNNGDLIKMTIGQTNRITIDLSEYQKVCEHLLANIKYMIDKFTGLVPSVLLDQVTQSDRHGSVVWLEEKLVNMMFNKLNKPEATREVICIDNFHKLMPVISHIIFDTQYNMNRLMSSLILEQRAVNPVDSSIPYDTVTPLIRDAFKMYDTVSRGFAPPAGGNIFFTKYLFTPSDTSLTQDVSFGVVSKYNSLIYHYMNDLYDAQSHKIYTKAFASFAGSSLIPALNGESYNDFDFFSGPGARAPPGVYYKLPVTQRILSSTIAKVMSTMITRVHPTTGIKIHELASLEEVSAHTMEKYRSVIPMYIRTFKAFIERCKIIRKVIGKLSNLENLSYTMDTNQNVNTSTKESIADAPSEFATRMVAHAAGAASSDLIDSASLYLDEIVSGMMTLLADAQSVQKELLETDSTVPLYFDVKKDFTKNYITNEKELPFAPLSILTMALSARPIADQIRPVYDQQNPIDNKFLYGLRSLLLNDFKISSTSVPYLKKLVGDFNGYSTTSNHIADAKFNDVLQYVGRAMNYIYDLRFFNGRNLGRFDALGNAFMRFPQGAQSAPRTYQEVNNKSKSMTLVESVSIADSRNKIAQYVKDLDPAAVAGPMNADAEDDHSNPRAKVILVNLVDLNIVPVNVHSLMREVPLVNLYNYAMTFDGIVEDLQISRIHIDYLKSPYKRLRLISPADAAVAVGNRAREAAEAQERAAAAGVAIDAAAQARVNAAGVAALQQVQNNDAAAAARGVSIEDRYYIQLEGGNVAHMADFRANHDSTDLRFIRDVVSSKLLKGLDPAIGSNENRTARLNSKVTHNLMFLTLVQYAIKKKVKREIDFVNTRVVSDVRAVNDAMTDMRANGVDVNDNIFQF